MLFPNIEAERARYNTTKKQLAEKLEVSSRTVDNWLKGRTEIPSSALIKMALLWNCSIDYLLNIQRNVG